MTHTVDSIMALADAYACSDWDQEIIPPEARAALLTALQEFAAEKGEPVAYIAWKDGKPCYEGDDAICEDAVWPVDSDDDRTSMPVFTAPQPAQPSEPAQPEYFAQYEYALDFSVLVAVYRRRADQTPELIHKEALPKQIGDGQPAQPEQGDFEDLLDMYWDLAYAEGHQQAV